MLERHSREWFRVAEQKCANRDSRTTAAALSHRVTHRTRGGSSFCCTDMMGPYQHSDIRYLRRTLHGASKTQKKRKTRLGLVIDARVPRDYFLPRLQFWPCDEKSRHMAQAGNLTWGMACQTKSWMTPMPDFLCPHALFVSDVCSEVISYERAGNIYTHIYIYTRTCTRRVRSVGRNCLRNRAPLDQGCGMGVPSFFTTGLVPLARMSLYLADVTTLHDRLA